MGVPTVEWVLERITTVFFLSSMPCPGLGCSRAISPTQEMDIINTFRSTSLVTYGLCEPMWRCIVCNFFNKAGEKRGNKDRKKTILWGVSAEQGTTGFSPVTGERAGLAEPLCSRCCFLIGNSASNKAFHLLSLVKCFHSISKWCNYPRRPRRAGGVCCSPCCSRSQQEAWRRISGRMFSFRNPNTIKWGGRLHSKHAHFNLISSSPHSVCV